MKNQKGTVSLVVIISVVVVALVVGYFAFQKPDAPKTGLSPTNDTNNQNQAAETGETAGWQTYHNEEYGFEFKYPPSINNEPMDIIKKEGNANFRLAESIRISYKDKVGSLIGFPPSVTIDECYPMYDIIERKWHSDQCPGISGGPPPLHNTYGDITIFPYRGVAYEDIWFGYKVINTKTLRMVEFRFDGHTLFEESNDKTREVLGEIAKSVVFL